MTLRYRCKKASRPHSFSGIDPNLIRQLPLHFQAAFPAILTHRSGVSKAVAKLMRPLHQHGVGPYRFQRIMRIMHMEYYDDTQLQYYSAVESYVNSERTGISSWLGRQQDFIPFSSFKDKLQYNGYIPSANYLSYVYSSYIASLRPFMDQLMSFVDGIVLKGDHSFKIIDHLAKINGVSTFSCLYTLLNEYEEIRLQVISHSKKMDMLTPQFLEMMETYKKLGMKEPELFYTDNVVGDESFLKQVIPSLTKDVIPIPKANAKPSSLQEDKYALLQCIKLPEDVIITVLSNEIEINEACYTMLSLCSQDKLLYVGFDCEWEKSSVISLMQISFEDKAYLFRVQGYSNGTLPCGLSEVLTSKNILKTGRNIQGDFTRIKRAFGVVGQSYFDIGKFCKDRDFISTASTKLANICGEVLNMRLPKVPTIRCGLWEQPVLSEEQRNYAALDAWVSWKLFEVVNQFEVVNEKVNNSTPPNTFVAIYNKTSDQLIPSAFGYLDSCERSKFFRTVKVIDVKIPGMSIDNYEAESSNGSRESTLGSLGSVPFVTRFHNSCLKTASEALYKKRKEQEELDLIMESAERTAGDDVENEVGADNAIPSRILKDAFHVMQMMKVSLKHGMAKEFARRLRDAIFVIDQEDKKKVEDHLKNIGADWDSYLVEKPDYLLERVRRYIPPPQELYKSVSFVFEKYGNALCVSSGRPLFTPDNWQCADRILEEIRLGHVSDLKNGPALYVEKGLDKNGLMRYHCIRGTNSVEGAVHMNIVRKFSSYNAGPRLANSVLADYRLYHNIDVS